MRKGLLNAVGWLLPVLVALVATPWLIRELGTPRYGVWALCVMLGALIPTLDLGYGVAATRELAGARNDIPRLRAITGELMSLALALGAAAWTAVTLGSGPISRWLNFEQAVSADEAQRLLGQLGPWIAVAFLNGALTVLPRAQERFGPLALLAVVSSLTLWTGATALASAGATLSSLIMFGTAVQLAMCVALAVLHRRIAGQWPQPALRIRTLPRISKFAIVSFAGALTSLATYHADKALVSAFIGPAAAGLYTAAANVANRLLGLVASLGGAVYPRVSMLHAGGDRLMVARLYYVSARISMTVAIALGVVGVVLAERFLQLWLGANVTPALVHAFRLLIVAYVMASASVVASNVLSGQGNAHRGAWFAALGGVLTVLAGLILIPRLGLAGAGWAGVVGMSQALAFNFWMERDLRAEHPELARSMRHPWIGWIVVGSVTAIIAWASERWLSGWIGLVASGALALTVWVTLWFTGGFASNEERQVVSRLRRAVTGKSHDRTSA